MNKKNEVIEQPITPMSKAAKAIKDIEWMDTMTWNPEEEPIKLVDEPLADKILSKDSAYDIANSTGNPAGDPSIKSLPNLSDRELEEEPSQDEYGNTIL